MRFSDQSPVSGSLKFVTEIKSSSSAKEVTQQYNNNLAEKEPKWLEGSFEEVKLTDVQELDGS